MINDQVTPLNRVCLWKGLMSNNLALGFQCFQAFHLVHGSLWIIDLEQAKTKE